MLFTWLLIFCHAVVPHIHASDELIHSIKSGHDEQEFQYLSFCDCMTDEDTCEVSEFLFQKFQNDHFFLVACFKDFASESGSSKYYDKFFSGIPLVRNSDQPASRAPPAA